MKKGIYIIFLIIILFILSNFKKETVLTVSRNIEELYQEIIVYTDFINTNNFNDYFKNINVLRISGAVHPVYNYKMMYKYDNIDNFKKYYLKALEKKGYYKEVNKYSFLPIKIDSIIIYDELDKLLTNFSDREIESCEDTLFYCVKIK